MQRSGSGRRVTSSKDDSGAPTHLESKAPIGSHAEAVTAAVVSPVSYVAVTAGADLEIKAWDLATGQEACVMLGHKHAPSALHFTAHGEFLISGDVSGTVMVKRNARGVVTASNSSTVS